MLNCRTDDNQIRFELKIKTVYFGNKNMMINWMCHRVKFYPRAERIYEKSD